MSDGGLRRIFRARVDAHWTSVETGGTGLGVADSHYCLDGGACGWVELKAARSSAVRVRPEQVAWLESYARRGGRAFVAVRRARPASPRLAARDELLLFPASAAGALRALGADAVPALGRWDGGPARWDWARIRQVLARDPA